MEEYTLISRFRKVKVDKKQDPFNKKKFQRCYSTHFGSMNILKYIWESLQAKMINY